MLTSYLMVMANWLDSGHLDRDLATQIANLQGACSFSSPMTSPPPADLRFCGLITVSTRCVSRNVAFPTTSEDAAAVTKTIFVPPGSAVLSPDADFSAGLEHFAGTTV